MRRKIAGGTTPTTRAITGPEPEPEPVRSLDNTISISATRTDRTYVRHYITPHSAGILGLDSMSLSPMDGDTYTKWPQVRRFDQRPRYTGYISSPTGTFGCDVRKSFIYTPLYSSATAMELHKQLRPKDLGRFILRLESRQGKTRLLLHRDRFVSGILAI